MRLRLNMYKLNTRVVQMAVESTIERRNRSSDQNPSLLSFTGEYSKPSEELPVSWNDR